MNIEKPSLNTLKFKPNDSNPYSALAKAEEEIECLKDKRLQERFYFVTAIVLLLDSLILRDCNTVLIIFICITEALVLLSLAEKWGVEQIGDWAQKIYKLLHKYFDAKIAR